MKSGWSRTPVRPRSARVSGRSSSRSRDSTTDFGAGRPPGSRLGRFFFEFAEEVRFLEEAQVRQRVPAGRSAPGCLRPLSVGPRRAACLRSGSGRRGCLRAAGGVRLARLCESPAEAPARVPGAANPGPCRTATPCWYAVAAARARSSAASFSSCPAWPRTHSKVYLRPTSAWSISLRRSTFSTGLPSALRQPLRFQPGIHLVTALMTYWLSQRIRRSSPGTCAVARNRSSTAISSPWLFVPWGQPPAPQQSSFTYQAQPAGPGFPKSRTVGRCCNRH